MNNDPQIPIDTRIRKGCVAMSERGQLFIAILKQYRPGDKQGRPGGWSGIGFNGNKVIAGVAEWVSDNVNDYINSTYGTMTLEERLQEANEDADNA